MLQSGPLQNSFYSATAILWSRSSVLSCCVFFIRRACALIQPVFSPVVCCLLVFLSWPALAKDLHYQVDGIDGALKTNVEQYLAALPSIPSGRSEFKRRDILKAIHQGMQALGYYQPDIELQTDDSDESLLHVKVTAHDPVRIRHLEVKILGDALNDPAFDRLLTRLPLKQGDVLHHGKYEEIKTTLTNRALSRGYFNAEMVKAKVSVYADDGLADIFIEFSSGHRYKFGETRIVGITQTAKLINPLRDYEAGDPYQAQKLASFSQSISETRYFKQVDVHPLLGEAKDYTVPVYVGLEPKSSNLVETGVGYSTDEGPRVQLNWEKPWLNQYGHSFTSENKYSAVEQDTNFNYRIPGKDPINDYYNLQTGYVRKDLNDTFSSKTQAGVHYWTKKMGDWQRDYFVRLEHEAFRQGSDQGNTLLWVPGITLDRLKMDKSLDPEWGSRVLFTAEFSRPEWGSDLGFTRLWLRSKWLTTPWDGARFTVRFEQGSIIDSHVYKLPSSWRFFAGGDQSVRGFGYETISPEDESGQLTGARNLTAGSIEYAHPVAERWRLATFVDAGTATNDYRDPVKVGTGMGVRWLSPLGPVRIDLAFGVSETHIPWRLHFGLGAEL